MRKALVVAAGLATLVMPMSPANATAAGSGVIDHSCGPKINLEIAGGEKQIGYAEVGSGFVNLWMSKDRPYKGRKIYYSTARLKRGEKITLDWSDTGGRTWHGCYAKPDRWGRAQTWAVDQWGGRSFRGCVYSGRWKCTGWKSFT
ncbi:hypothetical protein ACIBG8_52575 [Nonomuraea sp. NPDC050556]|uniref:hypothetical protein n=1 Tax=Nonomuraea sp. NPDC050556 TaxID=3364369 RepID=UPI0037BD2476